MVSNKWKVVHLGYCLFIVNLDLKRKTHKMLTFMWNFTSLKSTLKNQLIKKEKNWKKNENKIQNKKTKQKIKLNYKKTSNIRIEFDSHFIGKMIDVFKPMGLDLQILVHFILNEGIENIDLVVKVHWNKNIKDR